MPSKRWLVVLCLLVPWLTLADHSTLRNDEHNPNPVSLSGQTTAAFPALTRENLEHELPQWLGKIGGAWVYAGGMHATAGGLTSPSFATEAFTPERINQTSTAITYPAVANDICWAIISSDNNGITGWTRVGTTAYYVQCEGDTTPNIPVLPSNSAFMLTVTITASAIAAVSPVGPRSPSWTTIDVTRYPGADIGAKINTAQASLPGYAHGSAGLGVEGGVLRIPAGEYVFSTPIVITRQGACLTGEGLFTHDAFTSGGLQSGATVLRYTGVGTAITFGQPTNDQHQGGCFKNFKLIVPANAEGIRIEEASNWGIIEEVALSGPTSNRTGAGIRLQIDSTGWRIKNTQIENFGTGVFLEGNNGGLSIEGSHILRNSFGIVIGVTSNVDGVVISNNNIRLNETVGIDLRRSNSVSIANNYLEAAGSFFGNSKILSIGGNAGENNGNTNIIGNYMSPGGAGVEYAMLLSRGSSINIFFNSATSAYTLGVVQNLAVSIARINYGWNTFNGTPTPEFSNVSGMTFFGGSSLSRLYTGDGIIQAGGVFDATLRGLVVDPGANTTWSLATLRNANGTWMQVNGDGTVHFDTLKTTGSAGGKVVVCVDTATARLYASSSGSTCVN